MKNRKLTPLKKSRGKPLPTGVKIAIKWAVYVLSGIAAFILCTTGNVGSSRALFFFPIAICISIFEQEIPAAVMGAYLGLLTDIATDRLLGFTALYLCVICGIISALFRQLLRKNVVNFAILSFVCEGIYLFLCRYFFYTIWQREGHERIFTSYLLPSGIKTYVFGFAVFGLVYLLVSVTGDRKKLVIEEESDMVDRI